MHEIEIKNIEEEKDKSLNVNKFHKKLKRFNECMDYIYGYPMFLLENIVNNIYSFVTNHTISCSLCLCASITTTISITSIAVGVGIGLGVGCTQTNYIYNNSTNT